ncbi:membrane protein [Halopseudomonas pelagia]|uniref:membrane protein n=1 Tax=Halopseudomonas pelagia TaxID=553151 RepID=UPI0003A28C4C|nr:membrane protein [Halopseudomonas pelagia]
MLYLSLKTLHLLMAIAFIGTLFFQVFILAPVGRQLSQELRGRMAVLYGQQARRVIHWVALLLYGAGVALVWPYRQALADPLASSFSVLLSLKLLLAVLIIGHYVALIALRSQECVTERGMRLLNISLLVHAVVLVFCAKAMFTL